MNKKISLIITVFVLSFTFNTQDSEAALFNWKTEYFPAQNDSKFIPKSWGFSTVFNRSADIGQKEEAKNEDETPAQIKVVKTHFVQASAYSSTVDQTDSTPFITASGTIVKDGIIAANFLPFGTTIRIPDVYGDKIFVVEDRMNRRYRNNIDIWFPERELAKEFGRKNVKIEIVRELDES